MNNLLNLYPHNLEGYNEAKKAYQEGKKIVSEVRATGTGKSYINLQFALDNQDKKGIYVVPSLSIIEHLKEIVNENSNVSLSDFSHVDFRTYQSFVNMSYDEIKNLACDFLIVDELHHLNGPVWENRISKLIETHPDIKVLGTTAYTVVSRGTSYERDMALISTLSWEEMYEYACIYYEYHGDLEVSQRFKTNNGWEEDKTGKINLGIWICNQKNLYQKKEMSEERIVLLENIGIKWMSEKVDNKLQMEEITEKNTRKKQIELLNRTKSLLNHIGNQDFGSKEDVDRVNQKFVDELNRKSR